MQDHPRHDHDLRIGEVETSSQVSTYIQLDRSALAPLQDSPDEVLALSGAIGGQVKIRSGKRLLIGNVRALVTDRFDGSDVPALRAEIELLGEGVAAPSGQLQAFRRGLSRHPSPGDSVYPVTVAELSAMFSHMSSAGLEIGHVYPTSSVRAMLDSNALLSRHFALLGSTGCGKSSATALLLHRLIDQAPHGHIIVIDPHGEYPRSFGNRGKVFDVDNLALPYWLMNFEEHCEVFITSDGTERELDISILARCLSTARAKSLLATPDQTFTVDSPVPYVMADLLGALESEMGRLDNVSEISRYVRLRNRMNEVLRDNRYSFMFSRALTADTMKQFLARILRMEDDDRPIAIIDLSGVPSDIVSVVVALISRIAMDHAIWSRAENHRPVLLVCEEAHRYIPVERVVSGAAVRRSLERIAKEGRKYGISLGLVSQRPSDLAEGALSQCGTIISMRLNNDNDQSCVRNAMPEGGRGLLDALPALRTGECIISGEAVALPVRITLDLLPEALRPHSEDPDFMQSWSQPADGGQGLERTVRRWRHLKSVPVMDPAADIPSLLRR